MSPKSKHRKVTSQAGASAAEEVPPEAPDNVQGTAEKRRKVTPTSKAVTASDSAAGGGVAAASPGTAATRARQAKAVEAAGQPAAVAGVAEREDAPAAGEAAAREAGGTEPVSGGGGGGKRQRKAVVVPEPEQLCFCPEQTGLHIGTSGYSYKHWRQGFCGGLPQHLEFERYSREFDMVELNAKFYGWFDESTYDAWRDRAAAVRPSFQYVVKASQFYTHRKRLNVDAASKESWGRFWARCQRLRPHLGPVLFQFPANFRTTSLKGGQEVDNIDKLRRLGQVLPAGEKFVFEFRDISWYCREVYDVLRQYNWCLAITHCTDAPHNRKLEQGGWIGSLQSGPNPRPDRHPLDCCSWGVYVGFHGAEGQYMGAHGPQEMRRWADAAKRWLATGRSVWLAFNNDTVPPGQQLPAAIPDCRALAAALRGNGVWPG